MGKKSIYSWVLVCLLPGLSSALEVKNVKLIYGPLGIRASSTISCPPTCSS